MRSRNRIKAFCNPFLGMITKGGVIIRRTRTSPPFWKVLSKTYRACLPRPRGPAAWWYAVPPPGRRDSPTRPMTGSLRRWKKQTQIRKVKLCYRWFYCCCCCFCCFTDKSVSLACVPKVAFRLLGWTGWVEFTIWEKLEPDGLCRNRPVGIGWERSSWWVNNE